MKLTRETVILIANGVSIVVLVAAFAVKEIDARTLGIGLAALGMPSGLSVIGSLRQKQDEDPTDGTGTTP